jgi:hypothetical protein
MTERIHDYKEFFIIYSVPTLFVFYLSRLISERVILLIVSLLLGENSANSEIRCVYLNLRGEIRIKMSQKRCFVKGLF